eukprot:GDKJ01057713.1.p1 GENE.GDKJ01057713.1~~GDKJ01057713.1.p1  ORF type:complete len:146 (+),score=9.32 GDKJ01057713.1:264-701(+)
MTTTGAEGNPYATLRDLGMDINAADNDGNTPLHIAVINKKHMLVPYLIAAGADNTLLNHQGESPVAIAERLLSTSGDTTQQSNSIIANLDHCKSSLVNLVSTVNKSQSECSEFLNAYVTQLPAASQLGLFSSSNANTFGIGGLYF